MISPLLRLTHRTGRHARVHGRRIARALPWQVQSLLFLSTLLVLYLGYIVPSMFRAGLLAGQGTVRRAIVGLCLYGCTLLAYGGLVTLAAGAVALSGRPRTARVVFVIGFVLFLCLMIADAWLATHIGHHVLGVIGVAFEPHALDHGGNLTFLQGSGMRSGLLALGVAVSLALGITWLWVRRQRALRPLALIPRTWRRGMHRALVATPLLFLPAGLLCWFAPGLAEAGLRQHVAQVAPANLARLLPGAEDDAHHPALREAATALHHTLADPAVSRHLLGPAPFPAAPAPADPAWPAEVLAQPAAQRPDILLIVLESWRSDAFTPAITPHFHRLGERGLQLRHHYSNGNETELGLFSLLYGRSPLEYFRAEADNRAPVLLELLRQAGYHSTYITSQFGQWRGMERFMGTPCFDEALFVNTAPTRWQRDAEAVAALKRRLAKPRSAPRFTMLFLDATHMGYDYPPDFHRFPVDRARVSCDPGEKEALLSVYHNAAAYDDELLGPVIEGLDLSRTLVAVTGDHAEAFWDDGTYGHTTRLSDAQCRVPFVLAGPGITPAIRSDRTQHLDLLPTLMHALAGRPVDSPGFPGRDWLADPAAQPDDIMLVHPRPENFGVALLHGDSRIAIGCRRPRSQDDKQWQVLGFAGPQGELIEAPQSGAVDSAGWHTAIQRLIGALDLPPGRRPFP